MGKGKECGGEGRGGGGDRLLWAKGGGAPDVESTPRLMAVYPQLRLGNTGEG